MSMRDSLAEALASPSPEALWGLQGDLLETGVPAGAAVWEVLAEFHGFLDRLATATSSREYSHLASKMDIGAVGGVVVEHVLETKDPREIGMRLLTGLFSEGLMVLASRQYVKAAEGELEGLYRGAARYLYRATWHWSEQQNEGLDAGERRRLLDRVFAPVFDTKMNGAQKALLLGQLFQILLVSGVAHAVWEIKEVTRT